MRNLKLKETKHVIHEGNIFTNARLPFQKERRHTDFGWTLQRPGEEPWGGKFGNEPQGVGSNSSNKPPF